MAILRNSSQDLYNVGAKPPTVKWTVVRGDTSAFKVYVTDDEQSPLVIADWNIAMKIKRPNLAKDLGVITDNANTVMLLTPAADADDLAGEFTVKLAAEESHNLQTGDIFDIELSTSEIVWTVAQGSLIILEDVTD
jgi:hypothetical protein